MPDASDRIPPTFYSLSPERWAAIFEDDEETEDCGCSKCES
jgi:hypothetical protein